MMCQTLSNQINQQPLPFDEKNKKKNCFFSFHLRDFASQIQISNGFLQNPMF